MKYAIALLSLIGLLTPVFAQETDFTKAYVVIPQPVSVTETDTSDDDKAEIPLSPPQPVLHISGIKTTAVHDQEVTTFYWKLSLKFDSKNGKCHNDDLACYLMEAIPQNHFDPQLLEQQLRGTLWKGKYQTSSSLYHTELRIKSVQAGFIGGEILHTTKDKPDPSSFLNAKVVGDIVTQFLIEFLMNDKADLIIAKYVISEDTDGKVWINAESYREIVAQINQINEDSKEGDEIIPNPEIIRTQQLIRLRRTRIIGNLKNTSSRWGSHHEYRMTLEEGDKLIGSVGTPPKSFGAKDVLTGIGNIELKIDKPVIKTEPPEYE